MLQESSMEDFDLLTNKQGESIQRFIEGLQKGSIKDYRHFIKLLYETRQEPLITKLITSCKEIFYQFDDVVLYNILRFTIPYTLYKIIFKCFVRCRAKHKYRTRWQGRPRTRYSL